MGRLDAVDLAFDARSDTGRRRPANEDAVLALPPVFLVADGMGGYEAGDRASAAVVGAFRDGLCGAAATGGVELVAVRAALVEAERRVEEVAAGTRRGAGSTLSGVVLLEHEGEPYWLVLNVGDSRVYRHFGAELEQLTIDHSLVQELVDAGELRADERRTFEERNVITRAIGAPDARADSWLMPVTTGERLLVCSDGLHGELADEEILAILTFNGRPASATTALVDAANRAGGRDNVSVVVVDVRGGGAVLPEEGASLSRSAPFVTGGAAGVGAVDDDMVDDDTVEL